MKIKFLVFSTMMIAILAGLSLGRGFLPIAQSASNANCSVPSSSYTTIQSAVDDLNCTTIQLTAALYRENVKVFRNIEIHGAGSDQTVIDAQKLNSAFQLLIGTAFTLTNMTMTNGEKEGAGVYLQTGTVYLENVKIEGNVTSSHGSGILATGGRVFLVNSSVSHNTTTNLDGGAFFIRNAQLHVINSQINSNMAGRYGGGINLVSGSVYLTNTQLLSNTANSEGGAIYGNGTLSISGGEISHNESKGFLGFHARGGAIYQLSTNGQSRIEGTKFVGNKTIEYGGAIYNASTLLISDCQFIDNHATVTGGAIYNVAGGTLTVTQSTISQNRSGFGGAVGNNGGILLVSDSEIRENRADTGGGFSNSSGQTIIQQSEIISNSATQTGGAIWSTGGSITIEGSHLAQNKLTDFPAQGGGIYLINSTSQLTITDTLIEENSAKEGGGLFIDQGNVLLENSDIRNHQVSMSGAGIHAKDAELQIDRSRIEENSAEFDGGALYLIDGTTAFRESAIANNTGVQGGGVYNSGGNVTIESGKISGNQGREGAGIYNARGTVSLKNGAIVQNVATGNGGGVLNTGNFNSSNSTVSENRALSGGGIFNNDGQINLSYSTFGNNVSSNGSALRNFAGSSLVNSTIFAGSSLPLCGGSIVSLGFNLAEDSSCVTGSNDLTNQSARLDRLKTFGSTVAHPLLGGSPALDRADFTLCPAVDQRGTLRPFAGGCDIGAFESTELEVRFGQATYNVQETAGEIEIDVTLNTVSAEPVTIQYEIQADNATQNVDYETTSGSLTFPAGTTSQKFTVTILDDQLIEGDEILTATLSSPQNARMGSPDAVPIKIVDDEVPTISFAAPIYLANENGGSILIMLNRDPIYNATSSVEYRLIGDTALPQSDFIPVTGTVLFEPNVMTATFIVTLVDDQIQEIDESLKLELFNPINPLIPSAEATFIIRDDDRNHQFMMFLPILSKEMPTGVIPKPQPFPKPK